MAPQIIKQLEDGTQVKAVLWSKNGKRRVYFSNINRNGGEYGAGSMEVVNGKWTGNADFAKKHFGSVREMLLGLGYTPVEGSSLLRPPSPDYVGGERINPNAQPGDEGHICG